MSNAILIETLACFLPGQAKDLSPPLYYRNFNKADWICWFEFQYLKCDARNGECEISKSLGESDVIDRSCQCRNPHSVTVTGRSSETVNTRTASARKAGRVQLKCDGKEISTVT